MSSDALRQGHAEHESAARVSPTRLNRAV